MQTRRLDETKTSEALATIERNATLQVQLIEDLLDISRILQGKLTLNITNGFQMHLLKPLNPEELIAAIVKLMEPTFRTQDWHTEKAISKTITLVKIKTKKLHK